jgi:hypothetical protein
MLEIGQARFPISRKQGANPSRSAHVHGNRGLPGYGGPYFPEVVPGARDHLVMRSGMDLGRDGSCTPIDTSSQVVVDGEHAGALLAATTVASAAGLPHSLGIDRTVGRAGCPNGYLPHSLGNRRHCGTRGLPTRLSATQPRKSAALWDARGAWTAFCHTLRSAVGQRGRAGRRVVTQRAGTAEVWDKPAHRPVPSMTYVTAQRPPGPRQLPESRAIRGCPEPYFK